MIGFRQVGQRYGDRFRRARQLQDDAGFVLTDKLGFDLPPFDIRPGASVGDGQAEDENEKRAGFHG